MRRSWKRGLNDGIGTFRGKNLSFTVKINIFWGFWDRWKGTLWLMKSQNTFSTMVFIQLNDPDSTALLFQRYSACGEQLQAHYCQHHTSPMYSGTNVYSLHPITSQEGFQSVFYDILHLVLCKYSRFACW